MKAETKMVFRRKVQEKESKLKQFEGKLCAAQEDERHPRQAMFWLGRQEAEDWKWQRAPYTRKEHGQHISFLYIQLIDCIQIKAIASSSRKFDHARVGWFVALLQYVGGRTFYYLPPPLHHS